MRVAGGIIYALYSRSECRIEGSDWEKIFADAIGAEWKPSNVGLDDVQLGSCCWGAKSVKHRTPSLAKSVRLISGRNSPNYSYGWSDPMSVSEHDLGTSILNIWNARVAEVRSRFHNVRTVVLMKSRDLLEIGLFEVETLRYDPEMYNWAWNPRGNLTGMDAAGVHRFTWQPHGSQFTIVEAVPDSRVAFRLRRPEPLSQTSALEALGFDETWVEIL